MSPALTTGAAVLTMAVLLALTHVPLGTWVHRVFTDDEGWRVERAFYRLVGVDPRTEQRWTGYALSVVAFSVVSVVALFLLIMVQGWLPWSLGRSMDWHTAVNTAVSFMSNTNWQSYAGEAGTGYTVQSVGLTVQNFVSAAVGLAVAIALIRGIARHSTDRIGNFWVDLVRGIVRILLPLAVVAAIVLLVGGVIHDLTDPTSITALRGANPDAPATIPPDALTASGSGLDPHISPAYAAYQVPRVAAARGMTTEQVQALVIAHTQHAALGFIGQDRVTVTELNVALERAHGGSASQ